MSDKCVRSREIEKEYMQKFESSNYSFKGMSKYDIFCVLLLLIVKDGTLIDGCAQRLDECFDTVGRMLYAEKSALKRCGLSDTECYKIKLLSAFMDYIHFENYSFLSPNGKADEGNIKKYICEIMKYKLYEHIYIFLLDTQRCIREVRLIAKGTCREVILEHAELKKLFMTFPPYKYFIIAHNHADQSPPSAPDISSTKTIRLFGKENGMTLLGSYVVRGRTVSKIDDSGKAH